MREESFEIPFEGARVDALSARLDRPDAGSPERPRPILLAHGAGSAYDSPFLAEVAGHLVGHGFAVLRFQYPYREQARRSGKNRPPDRAPVLEAAHAAALDHLERRLPDRPVILAGKSLGGRMSTHLAAAGRPCAGLALLGYPLHPARKPDRERKEHFPRITVPSLFLQGTRDALCDLGLLEPALGTLGAPTRLVVIDEADHGFDLPKRSGRTAEEVRHQLAAEIATWDDHLGP